MEKCTKEGALASIQENLKSLHKRVDEVANINSTLSSLTTSVAVMAEQMQTTNERLEKLTGDVESLKDVDAESYKHYKRQVAGWVLVFILGAAVGVFTQ